MKLTSKYPSGYVPGKEFQDVDEPYGIKLALVTRVDEVELKCDLKILTGGGERFEVDLTQAMSGPRSFWGGIPEVNSLVIVGYRRRHKNLREAVILGYIANGKRSADRFDPLAPSDPSAIDPSDAEIYSRLFTQITRYKALRMQPGDVGGMSSSGSELVLSRDIRMVNRAGDLLELRDAERTLVSQSIHSISSQSGVLKVSGPARRSAFFTPHDIVDGKTPKGSGSEPRYMGSNLLKRFLTSSGDLLDQINNETLYPSVLLPNGKRTHYPSTFPGVNFESEDAAGAEPYVEDRTELFHTTDVVQEVREEIDGFQFDRRPIFIERVLGTVIGSDTSSDTGMQQYGKLLRPRLFDDFQSTGKTNFTLESLARSPLDDSEAYTTAGAYLFRINPPANPAGRNQTLSSFVVAVSKQGKLFANIPGSRVENYASGTKNVSAEINMDGALKMRLGASTPDNVAMHLTLEGGAIFDFRGNSAGSGLQFRTHSSYTVESKGVPDNNNLAYSENLQGNRESFTSADSTEQVHGSKVSNISGGYIIMADRISINASNGYGLNAGSKDELISGKTQLRYAQKVSTTVVSGGMETTVLEGGVSETLVVGSKSIDVLGGSFDTSVLAGSYNVQVTAGSISMSTAAGSLSLSAAAGSASMTAGLSVSISAGTTMSLTAPTSITLTTAQVNIGGPAATLGVVRGLATMPPGSPSLCLITGLPLLGSVSFRSLL